MADSATDTSSQEIADTWPVADGNGSVVAFAGHMIDAPTRTAPRLPASSEHLVVQSLQVVLDRCSARAGVTALASGGDILFAEAMLNRGADLHLALPLNVEEFLVESVRPSGDERWEDRFHHIREKARSEEIFGDDYLRGSGTPFQMAALLIDGKAQLMAEQSGLHSRTLGVWDQLPGDGMGGTASFIGHAVARGRIVRAIHPMTGIVFTPGEQAIAAAQRNTWSKLRAGPMALEHRLLAFLFADAKGFGLMRETQIPAFARVVLGIVGSVLKSCTPPPIVFNTWGDGLFVATEQPSQCAEIALRLLEGAQKVRHAAEGLPGSVTFRIGLHAGPAFHAAQDLITGRSNAYGWEVSRAARIEPIVDPGQAWASRAFVLLAEATGKAGLAFDDLGEQELSKGAGPISLFRLRRD